MLTSLLLTLVLAAPTEGQPMIRLRLSQIRESMGYVCGMPPALTNAVVLHKLGQLGYQTKTGKANVIQIRRTDEWWEDWRLVDSEGCWNRTPFVGIHP